VGRCESGPLPRIEAGSRAGSAGVDRDLGCSGRVCRSFRRSAHGMSAIGFDRSERRLRNPGATLPIGHRRRRPIGRWRPRVASPFIKEVARSRLRPIARSRATCIIVNPVQTVSIRRREGRLR